MENVGQKVEYFNSLSQKSDRSNKQNVTKPSTNWGFDGLNHAKKADKSPQPQTKNNDRMHLIYKKAEDAKVTPKDEKTLLLKKQDGQNHKSSPLRYGQKEDIMHENGEKEKNHVKTNKDNFMSKDGNDQNVLNAKVTATNLVSTREQVEKWVESLPPKHPYRDLHFKDRQRRMLFDKQEAIYEEKVIGKLRTLEDMVKILEDSVKNLEDRVEKGKK